MKRVLKINGYLYSQFIITLQNIDFVFKHVNRIHTWRRGGRYYAEIEVGLD